MAQVVAELEFAEVLRKMLPANVNMRTPDRAFDLRPETFDGIGMMDAVYPLVCGTVDRPVVVTEPCDLGVEFQFVGADSRAALAPISRTKAWTANPIRPWSSISTIRCSCHGGRAEHAR